MSEWKEYQIVDLLKLEYGKSLKDYRTVAGKYEVFGTNGKIGTTDSFLYDKMALVIGRKGAYREVHLAKEPFFVIDTAFYTKKLNELTDTLFIYYWFKNIDINSMDSGSAIPSTSRDEVYELEINLPPLPTQRAIASVLSSLDDKIDLLHRQNQTLEQMAETLFRQWFVEESDEDWEERRLEDFVSTNVASINKNYPHKEIEYLDTGTLTKGQWGNLQSLLLVDAPSRAKRLVKHNDILFSTVRPNQKHYGIVRNPIENLVVSTGFCVITCQPISPYFVYYLLTDGGMIEYLHSIAEGSTSAYPSLKPSDLEALEFALAPSDILDKFHRFVDDAWKKIEKNYTQIRTLTALRDTLLPKLMSGEVKVEMDEMIEMKKHRF